MRELLHAKFSQNPALRRLLLETGDASLHEAGRGRTVWTVAGDDALGKMLVELRLRFREADTDTEPWVDAD